MALTQQQLDLIDCLKLSGIEREEGVAIMLALAKSEVAMDKMLDYLIENLQSGKKLSVDEIMGKMYQITGMREGRFDVEDMENITMWADKKPATYVTVAPKASHSTSETIVISEADIAKIPQLFEHAKENAEKSDIYTQN